ncbi:hypothetical protein Patl1_33283 [Pistacia atlantica]|uniref:Uncharacterized protein n=1 Tax=Pistacia atlantica TaxID=434234 RepID=A0ACC1AQU2_9ROSI|nr:hypothetical protein Patl1_33283 [Pistacia atlantica]
MVVCILFSLFSLLTSAISSSIFVSAFSLVNDFRVLVSLKQGFLSPEPALTSWNSSNPSSVCSWAGIFCSQDRVVTLDLTDLDLGGSVSAQVSRLDMLTYLSLAGNSFRGGIEIANLSSLQSLKISHNQFTGGLDWNYSSLANLQVFDAYDNNFTALLPLGVLTLEIPESYGKLVGLEYLSLGGNDLRGEIPGELGNLTNLRVIFLGYYNVFEGGIPKEFGKLVNLVYMNLASCGLDGPIPHELGNLKLLKHLHLNYNLLSGSIPKQLGKLTNLKKLDLSYNVITGEIPYSFINLTQLKLLYLLNNKLHGSILTV